MAAPIINLVPSVKLGRWRKDDDQAQEADEAFAEVHNLVISKRDGWTCLGCGMKTSAAQGAPSGGFQVHHVDDDHHNNKPDNLATLCPFCHDVFHLGNAGARGAATAIWLPEISQRDLNILVHVMFMLKARANEKRATALDKETAQRVSDSYLQLKSAAYADEVDARIGAGMTDLRQLGEALAWLGNRNIEAYKRRDKFLCGVRILPDYAHYEAQAAFFSRAAQNAGLIDASKLEPLWAQWSL